MNDWNVTNSNILTPQPPQNSFVMGEGELIYAAVPYGNKLMIIHQGQQLKVCRNGESARNFIKKHQKKRK